MKTTISILTLILFVAVSTFDGNAQSQEKKATNAAKTTMTKSQNRTTPGPNFIDADGDGICDNLENGTPIRKRLRDGSCGNTPNPECTGTGPGTGTGTGAQHRRGSR